MGKVLDGKTFEPIVNAEVVLYLDEKIASMTSKTTPNPNITEGATKRYILFSSPLLLKLRNPDKQKYSVLRLLPENLIIRNISVL